MDLLESTLSLLARAAADTAEDGPLDGLKVYLFKENLAFNADTPITTFQAAQADYAGFTWLPVTWQLPTISDDGIVEVVGTVAAFRPTASTTENDIWGLYADVVGDANWVFAGTFDDAPLPMNNTLDSILVTLRYRPADRSICVVVS